MRGVASRGRVAQGRLEQGARSEGLEELEVALSRRVEAGEQSVDDASRVAGTQAKPRRAGAGSKREPALERPTLERARDGGAHGHDSPPGAPGARGLTQGQMARVAGLLRATWGHLETGAANPTLVVLDKVATALQVPIEELTSAPRASGRLYPTDSLRVRRQGDGSMRRPLPDPIPGVLIDRMEIPPGGRIPGVPHMPGTREYFTCETGEFVVAVAGEPFRVQRGSAASAQLAARATAPETPAGTQVPSRCSTWG